jgi:ribonuclease HI
MEPALLVVSSSWTSRSGGWACIIREASGRLREEHYGFEDDATSNRMLVVAVIRGLSMMRGEPVTVITNSEYLLQGAKRSHPDLWQVVLAESRMRPIRFDRKEEAHGSDLTICRRLAAEAASQRTSDREWPQLPRQVEPAQLDLFGATAS